MNSIVQQTPDLLYRYDAGNPWSHRGNIAPSESSTERGQIGRRAKMKKIYVSKNPRNCGMRKNAPFRNVHDLLLECCRKNCLSGITRAEIAFQRKQLYSQNYTSQNYSISSHIQRTILFTGQTKLIYTIPSVGQVCKTAFKKCFALSNKKISLLLKKKILGAPTLQNDLRGKHSNHARKLRPCTVSKVVSFIKDYNPRPSHYRRKTSSKLYFDSRYSMRGIWKDFIKENPNIKSTGLKQRNKGPPLSFSAFRSIFVKNMSHQYSFRIAHVDTCQFCDKHSRQLQVIEKALAVQVTVEARRGKKQELNTVKEGVEKHLKESEKRYAAMDYDSRVLATCTN